MPEATAAVIDQDGWLHTGDLARRDENGYYKIYRPDQGHDNLGRRKHISKGRSRTSSILIPRLRMFR